MNVAECGEANLEYESGQENAIEERLQPSALGDEAGRLPEPDRHWTEHILWDSIEMRSPPAAPCSIELHNSLPHAFASSKLLFLRRSSLLFLS